MAEFNIVKWLKNRIGYDVPTDKVEVIVMERGLQNVTDYAELTQKDKDLLLADVLFLLLTSATQTASKSWQSGGTTMTIGSQMLTGKAEFYNMMTGIYEKYNDPKLNIAESLNTGYAQWLE